MDVLSDIFRRIRLNSAVYFQHQFAPPWGMNMDQNRVAQFHVLVEGECWLQTTAMAQPVHLVAGDKVALMAGDAHWLSHCPEAPMTQGRDVLSAYQHGRPLFQTGDPSVTLVCGHFEFDRDFDHPFIHDLPRVIQVHSPDVQRRNWLEAVTAMLVEESASNQAGSQAVTERLAEVLFVKLLRAYIDEQTPTRGFLAALNQPTIYEALTQIHTQPAADLALESLARHVGMSRSAFAKEFRDLVGLPPFQYVTKWRMHRARELLHETDAPLIEIAIQVGYTSEAAFHRAFKRQFRQNPGAVRRARQ